jgi:hypothetical protein
MCGKKVKM